MKFLEDPKLLSLTNILSGADLGDRVVHGRIESYTCKSVKAEKVLSKEIEKQLVVEASTSPGGPNNLTVDMDSGAAATPSPLGPLNSSATRKLLVNLITTMNASFPDYDFSNLRPDSFENEASRGVVTLSINNVLLNGMDHVQPNFREAVWKTIDEVIELDKCEIYSWSPDLDSDMGVGKMWWFNYFFFNKKKKTLVLFSAYAISKMRGGKGFIDEDDANVDMDDNAGDDGEPFPLDDWDEPVVNSKQPSATASAFATPAMTAANGGARSTSVPSSPYFGAASAPQPAPPPVLHGHAMSSHSSHAAAATATAMATTRSAPMGVPMAAAAAASAPGAAPSSGSLVMMGPATPQQQMLMQQHLHHQQQHSHPPQRTMSAAAAASPQQMMYAQSRPQTIILHGNAKPQPQPQPHLLQQSAASITGRPSFNGHPIAHSPQTHSMMHGVQPHPLSLSQAQQQSPAAVLSAHGRTNSFAAAAALQQQREAKQAMAAGPRGSVSSSPAASPQIRPLQPSAGSPHVRPLIAGASGVPSQPSTPMQTAPRPNGVGLPSPALGAAVAAGAGTPRTQSAAQQQQQHQQMQAMQQMQLAAAMRQKSAPVFTANGVGAAAPSAMNTQSVASMAPANAIAFSQSMGIPLLKPISLSAASSVGSAQHKVQQPIVMQQSAPRAVGLYPTPHQTKK